MKLTSCTGRRCGGEKPARSNPDSDERREPASAMPFSEPCGRRHMGSNGSKKREDVLGLIKGA